MKKTKVFGIFLLSVLLLFGCGTSKKNTEETQSNQPEQNQEEQKPVEITALPQLSKEVGEGERLIQMETSMGNIKIKLFEKKAPKAVENFIKLSEKGYYNGLTFHRVIKDFMIQGGDPKGDGTGGESIWGKPFEDEFNQDLLNIRGALSMANSGANTNGSQFFIVQNSKLQDGMEQQMIDAKYPKIIIDAYTNNGGTPWLDFKHTVFGQVIEGMEVVDKIAAVKVDPNSSKPESPVTIKKITVLK